MMLDWRSRFVPVITGVLLAGALVYDLSKGEVRINRVKVRYGTAKQSFGVVPHPIEMLRADRIMRNVLLISGSPHKEQELYGRLERKLKEKWRRKSIARLFGYIDDPEEAVLLAVLLDRTAEVRSRLKRRYILPDSFVFAALNNEGKVFSSFSDDREILIGHGYAETGLDWFGSEFFQLRVYGLLDNAFSDLFKVTIDTNELNQTVPTAVFQHMGAMFEGFAATLVNRQRMVREACRSAGISVSLMSDEELLFWTYLFFNAGGGYGYKLIQRLGTREALLSYFHTRRVAGAAGNAFVVLAAAEWLERSGAFDMNPEGNYWWSRSPANLD